MTAKQFDPCARCGGVGQIPRGEYLREHRLRQHISLTALAERLHVSKAYISDIELGKRLATPKIVRGYEL
jgi:transcriptional regulator with XRE-family HTH domain